MTQIRFLPRFGEFRIAFGLALTFSVFLLTGCEKHIGSCLGGEQAAPISRYECLAPEAFAGARLVNKIDDGGSMSAALYALDHEVLLGVDPANYVLVISSFDIGEPVVLLGLKADGGMVMEPLDRDTPFGFSLTGSPESKVRYDVEVKGFNSVQINGVNF